MIWSDLISSNLIYLSIDCSDCVTSQGGCFGEVTRARVQPQNLWQVHRFRHVYIHVTRPPQSRDSFVHISCIEKCCELFQHILKWLNNSPPFAITPNCHHCCILLILLHFSLLSSWIRLSDVLRPLTLRWLWQRELLHFARLAGLGSSALL